MRQDLDIKPSEITLSNRASNFNSGWKTLKLWKTVHRYENGEIDPYHRNELAIHRYISPQLSTVDFLLDENFNLVFIQDYQPIHWGFGKAGTPIQFSTLYEEQYGLNTMGITLDKLNEIREIHQALIDAVSNIKVNYPQLIIKL